MSVSDLPATGTYTEIARRISLNSASVSTIKIQVKHQSAAGKVYIDDVTLTHDTPFGRLPLP